MSHFYAAGPPEWDRVVTAIRRAGVMGLDTEFYNVDPRVQSCVGRARVHLWSVAVPLGTVSPRGYTHAYGAVLPAEALAFNDFRAILEDTGITKAVHNLPVDAHALGTHAIALAGGVNTLSEARWYWPHLVPSSGGPGFGLKALKVHLLGKTPGTSFQDLFKEEYEAVRITTRKTKVCACGQQPCHKRGKDHIRHEGVVETRHVSQRERPVALESVLPGHPLWERALAYAAEDAVDALELHSLCQAQTARRPMPW